MRAIIFQIFQGRRCRGIVDEREKSAAHGSRLSALLTFEQKKFASRAQAEESHAGQPDFHQPGFNQPGRFIGGRLEEGEVVIHSNWQGLQDSLPRSLQV